MLKTLTKISGLVAPLRIGAMHGSHVELVKACVHEYSLLSAKNCQCQSLLRYMLFHTGNPPWVQKQTNENIVKLKWAQLVLLGASLASVASIEGPFDPVTLVVLHQIGLDG